MIRDSTKIIGVGKGGSVFYFILEKSESLPAPQDLKTNKHLWQTKERFFCEIVEFQIKKLLNKRFYSHWICEP